MTRFSDRFFPTKATASRSDLQSLCPGPDIVTIPPTDFGYWLRFFSDRLRKPHQNTILEALDNVKYGEAKHYVRARRSIKEMSRYKTCDQNCHSRVVEKKIPKFVRC